jgi:adenosine deaminase
MTLEVDAVTFVASKPLAGLDPTWQPERAQVFVTPAAASELKVGAEVAQVVFVEADPTNRLKAIPANRRCFSSSSELLLSQFIKKERMSMDMENSLFIVQLIFPLHSLSKNFFIKMQYTELHNHLYGSLSPEQLYEIGKKNPSPRWNIFTELYEKLYGRKINIETFFEDFTSMEDFKQLYIFDKPAPFLEFQSCFNLIIALVRFDDSEIREVAKTVFLNQVKDGIEYAEYRVTYSPMATKEDYFSKTLAACLGLQDVETQLNQKSTARLIITFHRGGNFLEQYKWIREAMEYNSIIQKYLVGIDFSNMEEGFPPKDKKSFFEKIKLDNQNNPKKALSILYHVGESFNDKTPMSAIRWVYEAAMNGADRLGHCIALGREFASYQGKEISELVSERLDQLEFELENYEELNLLLACESKEDLLNEKNLLLSKAKSDRVKILLDEKKIEQIQKLQNFVMKKIARLGSIIECCPTSNLRIGMLTDLKTHPIHRFIQNKIRVTISTDDPGIFATDIQTEYRLLLESGLLIEELEKIRIDSFLYKSEIVSKRTY